jgi:hypothetical protein
VSMATFLIVVNVLFVSPDVFELAFALLFVSLGAFVLVMLDEVIASVRGLRMLASDPALDRAGLRGAVLSLFAAFMTYVGAFVGQLLLVAERQFVRDQILQHRHFVAGLPFDDMRFAGAALLSMVLAVLCIRSLWATLRPREPSNNIEDAKRIERRRQRVELGRGFVALAFIALTWDQPFGTRYVVACALALLGSRAALSLLTLIPHFVVNVVFWLAIQIPLIVVYVLVYVVRRNSPKTKRDAPVNVEGSVVAYGEAALAQMELSVLNRPPWHDRIAQIATPLCHLVFIVVFWTQVV